MKLLLVFLLGCVSESRNTQSLMGGFSISTNRMKKPSKKELKFVLNKIDNNFLGGIYTTDSFFQEAMTNTKFTLFAFIKDSEECLLYFNKESGIKSLDNGAAGFQFSLEEFKKNEKLDLSLKDDSFRCSTMIDKISDVDEFYFVPLSHGQYQETYGLNTVKTNLNNAINSQKLNPIKNFMNELILEQISNQVPYTGDSYQGNLVSIKKK